VPGDAQIVEAVAQKQGWGTVWNDAYGTSEKMVRALLAKGIEITDNDLYATFGCQWEAVVWIVRRATVLTDDERAALAAARSDEWDAARDATWGAALSAARDAEWDAAAPSAWDAAGSAASAAAGDAAACAALSAVVWDLACEAGPFTFAHRDLLVGPWEAVIGLPPTLDRSPT